jgi:two-component system, cell cycle sensor histidine kinase and response regulator CckA
MSAAAEFPWHSLDVKAELRLLLENAPVGLLECQRQGNVAVLNRAGERMLGAGARTARSLRFANLIQSEDPGDSERLLRELFDEERDSFQLESLSPVQNGRRLRWTAWRVDGSSGEPACALFMVEEVTDERIEQRLQQAERLEAVGRLAGGVAHDFNNLLTGVLLYCDLLIASLEPGHRARRFAEEVRSAGIQASGLVRQLLAVARSRNSEPRLLSLNEIIEGVRSLLVRLIGENIELKFRLDPNLGLVRMDPTQAQQVLLNLVLNARDAMPGGGQITIETGNCRVQVLTESRLGTERRASVPCALFVVADNGSGMGAETRAHLFEAFFTTKAAGKGTGLGLATVHDIVTGSGGLIHVDSAPECGTRISVLLPLIPEAAPQRTNDLAPRKEEEVLSLQEEEE